MATEREVTIIAPEQEPVIEAVPFVRRYRINEMGDVLNADAETSEGTEEVEQDG